MPSEKSPVINCNFATNKPTTCYNGTLTIDSGAAQSFVPEAFLKNCKWSVAGKRTKEFCGAGGDALKIADYEVNMIVDTEGHGPMELKNVLVSLSPQASKTMLVGNSDINRLEMVLDYKNKVVSWGEFTAPMKTTRSSTQAFIYTIQKGTPVEDPDNVQQPHVIETDWKSVLVEDDDRCTLAEDPWSPGLDGCKGCQKCTDQEIRKKLDEQFKCPTRDPNLDGDPEFAIKRAMERIRQQDMNTYTHDQIVIDPEGAKRNPKAAAGIRKLVEEFKVVFSRDIGNVGEKYAVDGEIVGDMSKMRVGETKFEGVKHDAVMKQFLRQAAHGVLVNCREHGIEPKNCLRVLAVSKKDEQGNVLEAINNTRVVLQMQPVNAHSKFCGMPTDSLKKSLQFAARVTSGKALVFRCDMSDCYWTVPTKKHLWPYFCIKIPGMGIYCCTRCIQGWNKSAQAVQGVLDEIFWPLAIYMEKYMDDVVVGTTGTEDEYLNILRRFLQLCLDNNLKLKGSKCVFLSDNYSFLGHDIVKGTIMANKHKVLKLIDVELENILTKGMMKTFHGGCAWISQFMNRSQEVLRPLQRAMSGESSEKLIITPQLKEDFQRVKLALKELTALHPFFPSRETIMVVDTSLHQTGGFMYQINEAGRPVIVGFFSRTRKDHERKIPLSSCHIEILGAKAFVTAYMNWLILCEKTITLFTDSSSFVKIFAAFKRQEYACIDTVVNNAMYLMGIRLSMNVVHLKNTTAKIQFADTLSRLSELLGRPSPEEECKGAPECKVCDAANIIVNNPASTLGQVEKICHRAAGWYMSGIKKVEADEIAYKTLKVNPEAIFLVSMKELRGRVYTLRSLLDDKEALSFMQEKDPELRKLRNGLRRGVVNYPKRDEKYQRKMEVEKARLEHGVLVVTKLRLGQPTNLIPLPMMAAPIVLSVAHNKVGHGSANQMVNMVQRHFDIPKIKDLAMEYVNNCIKCSLYKGGQPLIRKQMKPVPVPEELFTSILMDELTRSYKNKNVKILIAMEAVSQFATGLVYDQPMNAETFVAMVAHCKTVLCPHGLDSARVDLRVDGAAWHTSTTAREALALMNVDLQVHTSETFSKNSIPELDVRMRLFGRHLRSAMEEHPVAIEVAVAKAIAKCNSTINHATGLTPAEVFSGRRWLDNKFINVDTTKLLEKVKERRQSQRRQFAKRMAHKQQVELELVPYENPELNSASGENRIPTTLKVGDQVQLKGGYGKNELPQVWTVEKIQFDQKRLFGRKTAGRDTGLGDGKWIAFEIVDRVFPRRNQAYQMFIDTAEPSLSQGESFERFWKRTMFVASGLNLLPEVEVVANEEESEDEEPLLKVQAGELPEAVKWEPLTDDEEDLKTEVDKPEPEKCKQEPEAEIPKPEFKEKEEYEEFVLIGEGDLSLDEFETPPQSLPKPKPEDKKKKSGIEDQMCSPELPNVKNDQVGRKSARRTQPIERFGYDTFGTPKAKLDMDALSKKNTVKPKPKGKNPGTKKSQKKK